MIERTFVSGRPASVAYIKQDFTPCSKEEAELIRVHWDDGDTAFLVPEKPVYKSVLKYNKCHDPKTGRFCSTGGGLSPAVEKGLADANAKLLERQKSTKSESAIAVNDKGEEILDIQGTDNRVDFAFGDVVKMMGNYLTHNHPGNRFPGLSSGDMQLAARAELKGIFVVQDDGSYFGATVPKLPQIDQEIRRSHELVQKLVWDRIDKTFREKTKPTVESFAGMEAKFWEHRDTLGAAEGYLLNTVMSDLGLIDLTVYSRGSTIEKAEKMLGNLDAVRKEVVDKIINFSDPKPHRLASDLEQSYYYRYSQLHTTYKYISGLRKHTG